MMKGEPVARRERKAYGLGLSQARDSGAVRHDFIAHR